MLRYSWFLLLLALAGCGSKADFSLPSSAAPATRVLGRVQLDRPFSGATVEFRDLKGGVVESVTPIVTKPDGSFSADLRGLPQRFVATASGYPVAGGSQESYQSEYDGFDPKLEQVMITPLTALVAVYHARHPELNYSEADAALKKQLRLPSHQTTRFHMVNGGHRRGFSVPLFLKLLRSKKERFSLLTVVSTSEVSPVTVDASNSINWTEVAGQAQITIVSVLLKTTTGLPVSASLSWTSLFFQSGPSLTEVAAALEGISSQIVTVYEDLSAEITESTLATSVATLNTQLGVINSTVEVLEEYQVNGASTAQTTALVNQMISTSYLGLLATIHNAQMGTTSATGLLAETISLQNITNTTFYSNKLGFNAIADEFNYYAGLEALLINTIIEGWRGTFPTQPQDALDWYDTFTYYVQTQETLVPLPLESDDVVYHRPSGLIFYATEQSADTYTDAVAKAATFAEGGYTNWRVATYADLFALLYNEGITTSKANTKPTNSITALKAAGFTLVEQSSISFYSPSASYLIGAAYSYNVPVAVSGTGIILDESDVSTLGPGVYSLDQGEATAQYASVFTFWQSTGDKLPYFLVCDATDQTSDTYTRMAALGTLRAISIGFDSGTQASATGTYDVNSLDQDTGAISVVPEPADITAVVAWSSSDPDVLRILNMPIPDAAGQALLATTSTTPSLNFKPGGMVSLSAGTTTLTASVYDAFSSSLTQVSKSTSRTVSSVSSSLEYVTIGPATLTLTAAGSTQVSATGYYSTGLGAALTSGVTWTSSITQAHVTQSGTSYFLVLDSLPSGVSSFTLTATASGKSETLTVNLVE